MGKVDFSKINERYGPSERTEHCAEWGGDVTLRRATSEERIEAALLLADVEVDEDSKPTNRRAMIDATLPLVSKTIVDGDSRPFDSDEGRKNLRENHLMAVLSLMPAVLEINMLGKSADDAIEAAKKNSPTATNGE